MSKFEDLRTKSIEGKKDVYKKENSVDSILPENFSEIERGGEFVMNGRLLLEDSTGKISRFGRFVKINGMDCIDTEMICHNNVSIRIFLLRKKENEQVIGSQIHYGDIVEIDGKKVVDESTGNAVIIAENIKILSKSISDIYRKDLDFAKQIDAERYRYLEMMRKKEVFSTLEKISEGNMLIRKFLYDRGFKEINIPILQSNFEAGFSEPFSTKFSKGADMFLRLTAEIYLRKMMIAGFGKIFEMNKSFRNFEPTNLSYPEFCLLEIYQSYAKEGEMEKLLKDLVNKVVFLFSKDGVIEVCGEKINFLENWEEIDFEKEFKKITGFEYDESIPLSEFEAIFAKTGIKKPSRMNLYNISTSLYSHMISGIKKPTLVANLPAARTPLNKVMDGGNVLDDKFLIINGMIIAEIVNAERDPFVISDRFKKQESLQKDGRNSVANKRVVEAVKYGVPPCRGIGVGLDHLYMILLNKSNIRDVQFFPNF